ncbi:MAG: GDSL-type esterase/lipase family protein [Propionivibrio sp.]
MRRRTFLRNLACSVLLVACGRKTRLPAVPPGSTVLAFGDSVTFGTGAASGEDWPSRLAATTRWSVVNAGISGDTAEAAKSRIQMLLDEHRPALVIIELGGNDFLRRRPPSAVKDDLRRIVQAAKAARARVVLVAVPELSLLGVVTRKLSDSPIYGQLGEEEEVPVIGDVFSDVLGRPELRADDIHPNAEGYRRMAAGIFEGLKAVGLVPAN